MQDIFYDLEQIRSQWDVEQTVISADVACKPKFQSMGCQWKVNLEITVFYRITVLKMIFLQAKPATSLKKDAIADVFL